MRRSTSPRSGGARQAERDAIHSRRGRSDVTEEGGVRRVGLPLADITAVLRHPAEAAPILTAHLDRM
ncbi:hypothetical protein ACXR2U_13300 [Jatrophihabitans sp. YIM 134969]